MNKGRRSTQSDEPLLLEASTVGYSAYLRERFIFCLANSTLIVW